MNNRGTPLLVALLLSLGFDAAHARLPGTLNFHDVTGQRVIQTVAEDPSNEKEVEVGDIDNDGDLDVVMAVALSDFGERRNKLYRNDGGLLQEVSGAPIIPGFSNRDVSRNVFLRDYDKDGWLDMIVINDSNSGGQEGTTKYYANRHPGGAFSHFEEETFRLNGAGGAACSGVSLDLDQDDDLDLYIGNYPFDSQDTLYLNDGGGFFNDVTLSNVPSDSDYTVDISAADLNGDGLLDLLVSNHFDPNFVYYNNNQNAGSGPGDYRYAQSTQTVAGAVDREPAMEPADFDRDGLVDFYFSNRNGTIDRIYKNTGNDAGNKATFLEIDVSGFPSQSESRKATVADLNLDGRVDVIVMGENRRPAVLRNTSVNGAPSFVDWTPGGAFPQSSVHAGWHAAALDTDGSGFPDIFVGGTNDDHLFANVASVELAGDALGGSLPAFHDADPLAVRARVETTAADVYQAGAVPAGAIVSVVLNGCSDYALEVRDDQGGVVASSSRGAAGIEEAVQFSAPGGLLSFEVSAARICGDGDGDGDVEGRDLLIYRACVIGGLQGAPICVLYDFNRDGQTNGADLRGLLNNRTPPGGAASGSYVLELLSRS